MSELEALVGALEALGVGEPRLAFVLGSGLGAFANLTPPDVLEALDAAGLRGDGRILQLNSYENRVWRVMLEEAGAVVVKAYRPGR